MIIQNEHIKKAFLDSPASSFLYLNNKPSFESSFSIAAIVVLGLFILFAYFVSGITNVDSEVITDNEELIAKKPVEEINFDSFHGLEYLFGDSVSKEVIEKNNENIKRIKEEQETRNERLKKEAEEREKRLREEQEARKIEQEEEKRIKLLEKKKNP